MKHEKAYEIILTDEGALVIITGPQEGKESAPFILYDGGNHATFYRRPDQTVLLDYINPEVIPIMDKAEFVVMMETNEDIDDIINDYKAPIKHVPHNPITDGLK